jgi:hypothetical protein
MRPEEFFNLPFRNRLTILINNGIYVRERINDNYSCRLYLMDNYYYEVCFDLSRHSCLYIYFIDETDVDFLFPGRSETLIK